MYCHISGHTCTVASNIFRNQLRGWTGVVVETLASHHCRLGFIHGIATFFVSEFGCWSYIGRTSSGFLWILQFSSSSKIGFLTLIGFSLLCCSCINLHSTTTTTSLDPIVGYIHHTFIWRIFIRNFILIYESKDFISYSLCNWLFTNRKRAWKPVLHHNVHKDPQ